MLDGHALRTTSKIREWRLLIDLVLWFVRKLVYTEVTKFFRIRNE